MANGGSIGSRGGRHLFLSKPERKMRTANHVVREILQETGQRSKVDVRRHQENVAAVETDRIGDSEEETRITSILLVDDHAIVREGLKSIINGQPGMHVVSEASNGQEAIEKFKAASPDVVLLDLRMPVMNGLEAASALYAEDPLAKVVILTSYQDEEDIYRVLQIGVRGYILKSAPISQLVNCIQAVATGNTWVPPSVGSVLARRIAAPELTHREQQVLQAMANGKSNKEIGVMLNISEGTVKVHMTHILEKLKVSGRTEAIGAAVKRGLVKMELAA
jgi:two-component system, NarL family, response regulator